MDNLSPTALKSAYEKAFSTKSSKVETRRLDRAMQLVNGTTLNWVHRAIDGSITRHFYVPGTGQPWYMIRTDTTAAGHTTVKGCTCRDRQRNPGQLCKHMLAVMLILRAWEIEQQWQLAEAEKRERQPVEQVKTYRERALAALYGGEE